MFLVPIAHRSTHNGQAHDLSRAFDRLFDDTAARVFSQTPAQPNASRWPALDVSETDTSYSVRVDLPGVAKEDLEVTIDGKKIAIEAEARAEPQPSEGQRQLVRERSTTAYARSFTLAVEVDEAASQAKLENGVLTLSLAKKQKPASRLAIG